VLVALLVAAVVAAGVYFACKLRAPPPRPSRGPPNLAWSAGRAALRAAASHACSGFGGATRVLHVHRE